MYKNYCNNDILIKFYISNLYSVVDQYAKQQTTSIHIRKRLLKITTIDVMDIDGCVRLVVSDSANDQVLGSIPMKDKYLCDEHIYLLCNCNLSLI